MGQTALKLLKDSFPKYYFELKKMKKVRQENLLSGLAKMITIYKYRIGIVGNIRKAEVEKIKEQLIKEMIFGEIDDQARKLDKALETLKTIEMHKKKVKTLINSLSLNKKSHHIFNSKQNYFSNLII